MRESNTELVLRTPEDREITLALKEIDEAQLGGSLMPDGLTDTLTRAEFVDLVRFLAEMGKVGPYAAGTGAPGAALAGPGIESKDLGLASDHEVGLGGRQRSGPGMDCGVQLRLRGTAARRSSADEVSRRHGAVQLRPLSVRRLDRRQD